MAFNPYDFFVLRPLRWAFGQTFGSKARTYFDQNLASLVNAAIAANSAGVGAKALVAQLEANGTISHWVDQVIGALKIPAVYRPIVSEFVTAQAEAYITAAVAKIK